jgi:hypothetical protein
MFMGLRLCEVVEVDEAMHFDALAPQPCGGHGPMTRSANALCALPHAQGAQGDVRHRRLRHVSYQFPGRRRDV